MPLTINDFVSRVSNDTLKRSRYDITIPYGPGSDLFKIRCEEASIPGTQLLTKDLRLYFGMPNLKIPSGREYDDLDFTFISTSEMKERKILEEWLYKINNFETNTVQYYDYIKRTN